MLHDDGANDRTADGRGDTRKRDDQHPGTPQVSACESDGRSIVVTNRFSGFRNPRTNWNFGVFVQEDSVCRADFSLEVA